jgi:hypothetical protein
MEDFLILIAPRVARCSTQYGGDVEVLALDNNNTFKKT